LALHPPRVSWARVPGSEAHFTAPLA